MPYDIYYDFSKKNEGSDYELISFDCVLENEELLTQTDMFVDWVEYMGYENRCKKTLIEEFKDSDSYYDLKESYIPIINRIEILQNKPTEKQLELVEKHATAVSVIYEYDLDFYGLGLRGCGMDLSEYLELAYYIIDGISPIKANSIMSLSNKDRALLEFCREEVDKNGEVCFSKIEEFINKIEKKEK